ncbi:SCO7613 C-terminal domain-containing membrane protein [Actinoplanes sp. NPDC051494]|uniref:SCO7613 C-terminal domain-containing membrane protein n=1 Tax=Actinoplanes sp. NPDC051494 TaxID=3363907 RepID=UPI0037A713F6
MISYPCPFCRAVADLASGCPGCGRGPDPDAAEVVRLDAEIPVLTARLAAARDAVGVADTALRRAWNLREAAATRVRAAVGAAASVTPRAPAMTAPVTTATAERSAPLVAEASTRIMQNTLFTLGGLLLAVAAIVFTAVAWSQFGVRGRAGLLAVATVVALAAPLVALRRKLTATAETFTAVGLVLVLLDGYAAWYVNLFGLADQPALGYAGAVFAVTAAIAAGFEHLTGLVGPRYAALLLAQPVLPLVVAPAHPGAAGWAYTMGAVAAANLAVIHLRRPTVLSPLALTAYGIGLIAVCFSGLCALYGLALARTPGPAAWSGLALVTAAGVVLAAALLARSGWALRWAAGLMVVALAVAASRFAVVTAGGFQAPLLVALVVTVLAVGVSFLPAAVRTGARAGAFAALAVPVVVALVAVALAVFAGVGDWRLPAILVMLTVGAAAVVPRADLVLTGIALLGLAAPAGFGLAWWSASPIDLAVLAAALVLAALRTRWTVALAMMLAVHAVVVAARTPGVAALTLAAIATIGFAATWRRTWYAGPALACGLLLVPAVAWQATAAFGWPAVAQSRTALGAAAALVAAVHVIGRYRRHVLTATLTVTVTVPLWALSSGDPASLYAAAGLLLVATLIRPASSPVSLARPMGERSLPAAALLLGAALVAATGRSLYSVFILPFGSVGGRPDGSAGVTDAIAVGVAALAVAAGVWQLGGRRAAAWAIAPVVVVGMPLAVGAADVPWPGVTVTSLVVGLGGLALAALGGSGRGRVPGVLAAVAGIAAGAGLAGAVATDAMALVAFGLVVIAGTMIGAGGRATGVRMATVRVAGWVGAAVAVLAEAGIAGRTAGLPLEQTAFAVLAAAALVLAVGALLAAGVGRPARSGVAGAGQAGTRGVAGVGSAILGRAAEGRAAEGRAVQAAAHGGALVALALTVGSLRHAAAVCTFWGLALGLRALLHGAGGRRGHVIAAAVAELGGAWLVLAAGQVAVVEAYTGPAAGVALLVGWVVRRGRASGVSSWVAYGPALAAALVPTLASVLVQEGEPLRRLLLGVAALGITVVGAHVRLRAPVVAGGVTLAVLALHEAVLVWDLLPRWIPLAGAGLVLVGLAMTLERRRRDVARLRSALTRMG